MAKATLYLDMRAVKDGRPGPIKIRVTHQSKTILLPTSLSVLPQQWMDGVIINHPRAKQWNNLLKLRMLDITSELARLDIDGKLSAISMADLKKRLTLICGMSTSEDESPADLFMPIFCEKRESLANKGSKSIYNQTESRLRAFDPYIEERTFAEMDESWLRRFEGFMALSAPKKNARNIHLRNIRSVFNYAINIKSLTIPYPFRTFKIQAEVTASRALTIEQLRLLKDYTITEPHLEKYRDIFMLMIYLRGINAADLFQAKHSDIVNGRLEYYRKKTGTFYSVKIEPEALNILNKYRGVNFLLDVCDTWSNPTDYLRKMDKGLKKIGPMQRVGLGGKKIYTPLLPQLSSYYARHTFASLAAQLHIPIEITSESLGHKIGSPTTAIYVHYLREQVDDATRKIIDFITKGA
mgnify:CR=1 FL=1